MLLDKFGKVVEPGRYIGARVSIGSDMQTASGGGDVPMASVKKQKPTMEPRMPTSGRIHMFASEGMAGRTY